eukprot:TRINITY_DN2574_c0_g1_i1.p1 TRINITY_DN2574_c0_g1~~TRINITY_DN2574_c0_g1_i1.p1  ORF type:complete len:119 (-),score=37.29 TRINITY_DN2574_c0_g1_i1:32-388(-)
MSVVIGKLLLFVSAVGLFHSGWTVIEFREFVAAASSSSASEAVGLPVDVVIELLISMLLGLLGSVLFKGPLKLIKSSAEFSRRSYGDMEHRKSFRVYGSNRPSVSHLAKYLKSDKKSK